MEEITTLTSFSSGLMTSANNGGLLIYRTFCRELQRVYFFFGEEYS